MRGEKEVGKEVGEERRVGGGGEKEEQKERGNNDTKRKEPKVEEANLLQYTALLRTHVNGLKFVRTSSHCR